MLEILVPKGGAGCGWSSHGLLGVGVAWLSRPLGLGPLRDAASLPLAYLQDKSWKAGYYMGSLVCYCGHYSPVLFNTAPRCSRANEANQGTELARSRDCQRERGSEGGESGAPSEGGRYYVTWGLRSADS